MFGGVARMSGRRVIIAGTAAVSLVTLHPGASNLRRQTSEVDGLQRVVKKSSFVTIDCA